MRFRPSCGTLLPVTFTGHTESQWHTLGNSVWDIKIHPRSSDFHCSLSEYCYRKNTTSLSNFFPLRMPPPSRPTNIYPTHALMRSSTLTVYGDGLARSKLIPTRDSYFGDLIRISEHSEQYQLKRNIVDFPHLPTLLQSPSSSRKMCAISLSQRINHDLVVGQGYTVAGPLLSTCGRTKRHVGDQH